ncbi:Unknown protein [Striga hermonthica]|uniref:Ubiquitin-like protease family profile domain-containing protein n=1 Tax=Striga hermonthica TaxID=68872 RepID=A0A9N7R419_STRHE|nr:Unknown protein [Striga hermonthica]
MLKWKCDNSFDRGFLVRKFFSLHHDQFSNIVPTVEEIERLHLDKFFNKNNEFIRHGDLRHNASFATSTSNNFDEQIRNLVSGQLQLQADCNSLKLLFHNFSAKVFEEFKVVHSTLKELRGMMDNNVNVDDDHFKEFHTDMFQSGAQENVTQIPIPDCDDGLIVSQSAEVDVQDSDEEDVVFIDKVHGSDDVTNFVKNVLEDANVLKVQGLADVQMTETNVDEEPNVDKGLQIGQHFDDLVVQDTIEKDKSKAAPSSSKRTTRSSATEMCNLNNSNKNPCGAPSKPPKPFDGEKRVLHGSFPFDQLFWSGYNPITEGFHKWLTTGLFDSPKQTESGLVYYKKQSSQVKNGFDFNVAKIYEKSWFLLLDDCHKFLDSTIDADILKDVECYSVLLPTFLYLIGLHYKREELFTGNGKYVGKQRTDPLEVVFIDNLPPQEHGDCGVFMIAFAEVFMKGKNIPSSIDAEFLRNRYAYLLYEHGCKKLAEGYESEDQSPGVMPPDLKKEVHGCWQTM